MSIKLRCTHCGKEIQAPEEAAGRWGKCPHCSHRVYIPLPPSDEGEISLVPLDEEDERRAERERSYYQEIEYRALSGGVSAGEPSEESTAKGGAEPHNLLDVLARYVDGMAQGRLADCDEIVAKLVGRQKEVAKAVKQLLAESSTRPQLRDTPPAVVKGYLKQLLAKL